MEINKIENIIEMYGREFNATVEFLYRMEYGGTGMNVAFHHYQLTVKGAYIGLGLINEMVFRASTLEDVVEKAAEFLRQNLRDKKAK